MKKCFFIALANDFEHTSNDVDNLVSIALELDFLSSTTSLRV